MELQLVQNEQFKVRKTEYEGETWFVGRDVAQILGYKNHTASIPRHVEEDDRLNVTLDTPYGQRVTTLVNEIGVYSLVLGSKLPEAKAFKRWICKEVIPSIRSTGAYMTAETLAQVQGNPEALAELTGIPVEKKLLLRTVYTDPQRKLNARERKHNLKNAFQMSKKIVQLEKVLLIDDIYTTGSTVDAAAETLMGAGVKKVYVLCICIGGGDAGGLDNGSKSLQNV